MAAEYCSLYALRERLGLDSSDTTDDGMLHSIIEATSRAIDEIVGRRFYASTETRYYRGYHETHVDVDDLLSVTTLASDDDGDGTYETIWATTDYVLLPTNATYDGVPYSRIEIDYGTGTKFFPVGRNQRAIKVVGSFGYSSSVPARVREASLLAAIQMYRRKDSPFGVMGASGFLQNVKHQMMDDPQIRALLRPYQELI